MDGADRGFAGAGDGPVTAPGAPNRIRADLARGRPSPGCWCTVPGTWSAEVLARAGFSWIVVDLQHGGPTWHDLMPVLQAVELGGAAAVVRVGWNDPEAIMRALDLGASGVIVPMVDDAAQAARAAEAARYPPRGTRSFGPLRNRRAVGAADADVLCLPMIETAAGLHNVEEIAATPGVDGLFVGPADLALSLGLELDPQLAQPEVTAGIDAVVRAARANGIVVGTVAATAEHARDLVRRGVDLITLGSDKAFVADGAAQAYADVARVTG